MELNRRSLLIGSAATAVLTSVPVVAAVAKNTIKSEVNESDFLEVTYTDIVDEARLLIERTSYSDSPIMTGYYRTKVMRNYHVKARTEGKHLRLVVREDQMCTPVTGRCAIPISVLGFAAQVCVVYKNGRKLFIKNRFANIKQVSSTIA